MRKLLLLTMLLFSSIAWCNQRYQGVCAQSGVTTLMGLNSTTTSQLTYPGATVTVNVVGGGLATIFSDNLGTPLANPFTASGTDASFSFYAANSSVNRYSVTCSGTGIPTISINPDALLFDPAVATFGTGAFSGNVSVAGTLSSTIIGQRVYADQKCATPGVFDVTCWQNAIAALPASGGTIVLGSHTYNFGASTLTISGSHIVFSGDSQGDVTTGGTRVIGTASPLIQVQGASAAVRAVKLSFRDLIIAPAAYNAAQTCFIADHVTDIDFRQVTFSACGQAEWLNDYFRVVHNRVSYSTGVGSGNTNTTAVVRLENISNPGTASEEAWWQSSIWEGDATLTGKQGTAVYVGPATSQTVISDSKIDYGSTASANTIIQLFKTLDFKLHDTQIANTTGTGSGLITILVDGAGGSLSTDVHIHDNTISMPNATGVGVRVNFGKAVIISNNFIASNAGTATATDITANSVDAHAFGNFNLNGDTAIADASASTTYLLPLTPGTNVLRSSAFNRMTLFGDLLVNGNSAGIIAALLNGADATGNVNIACGLTTGQDCQINFQDNTQTTKADILVASVAHGGRMSLQNGGNTGFQIDSSGLSYIAHQLTSTLATGTAPFSIASTTPVANLSLSGGAGTGIDNIAIGANTPAAGTFTTLKGTMTGGGSSVTLLNSQGPLAAVVGNATDLTLYTFTIPANTIGAGKGIRVKQVSKHTTGSGLVTYKLKLGATTLDTLALTSNVGVADDDRTWHIMNNAGVQNAQSFTRLSFDVITATLTPFTFDGTSAENTANALALTVTMNAANTEQVTPKQFIVELIQ